MLKFYVAGRVQIEGPAGVVTEHELPGRQGRLMLVRLLLARGPVTHETLADLLWGSDRPPSWTAVLSPLASRLRGALDTVGADGRKILMARQGAYELAPPSRWVDVEVATRALDRAQGHVDRAEWESAWADAAVASAVFRRPFLEDVDHAWAADLRGVYADGMVRALSCVAESWLQLGRWSQAEAAADEAIRLDPLREAAHRHRIRALAGAGNRARALRAYREMEERLVHELGVGPSAETERLFEDLLGVDDSA
ncbi:MAG: bacterial transcriptional activator domain-containing protein [Acidimicrobiia bacterium]|nr:bacterial transcriptional activator domain-containing protein [Acidimicrobiia bacterium]